MKELKYQGKTYLCPFSDKFRRHTLVELDDMTESLKNKGLRQKIVVYYDIDHNADCVLDGEGRMTAANRIENFALEFDERGRMTTCQAFNVAIDYNDVRRQDTPEEVQKRKKKRLEGMAQLRSEGKSIREIAEIFGISKSQVERDLDQLSLRGQLPFSESVTGKDGKKHPSKKQSGERNSADGTSKTSKRKALRLPIDSDDPGSEEPETLPAPPVGKLQPYYKNDGLDEMEGVYRPRFTKSSSGQEVVLDALNMPCPAGVGDTFAETKLRKLVQDFTILSDDAEQLRKVFMELKERREEHQTFTWANITTITGHIDRARDEIVKATDELRDAIPYVVCPKCHGERKGCRDCKSTGYWPSKEYEFNQDAFKKQDGKEVAA